MTCFVAVGCKTGDLLSILPIVHHEFKKTGQHQVIMASYKYAPVLNRAPYVTPTIWNGEWNDLSGALKSAKKAFGSVACVSTYGRDFPVEHRTSSFQLDAYDRAGVLHLWDTLPLIINTTKRATSRLLFHGSKPTILFADHSESSPFLGKQELYAMLVENFPQHDIMRLSDYRLGHIADFVDWYDHADALVAIETAHLHLSAATKTPIFVLATDRPSRWNGSAPSKRFQFYCRYSEYESRKDELIQSIKDTLSGVPKPEIVVLN